MKIEIIERDYQADDKLKALFLKKLQRLAKYFGEDAPARLVLSRQGAEYRMELTVSGDKPARAEAAGASMNKNIDVVIPRVARQFRKEHTRETARRGAEKITDKIETEPAADKIDTKKPADKTEGREI
ncbi:MAG: HPF/RaiA family ribosome-associated protein [Clostridiales bacterium]|nr:HPF/RaiA family ribosome-associated protein [Clostridiales bacterium]